MPKTPSFLGESRIQNPLGEARISEAARPKQEWIDENQKLVYECLSLLERDLGSYDILTRAQLTGALAPTHTLYAQPAMPAEGFVFDSGVSLSQCYYPNTFASYISSCFNYLVSKLTICDDHCSFRVNKTDLKRTWFIMWASGHGWRKVGSEMPSLFEFEPLGLEEYIRSISTSKGFGGGFYPKMVGMCQMMVADLSPIHFRIRHLGT